jgi:DNA-binding response OmpR family regulator
MNSTILLLEPDHDLNRLFKCLLESEGFIVHGLRRWQDAQMVLSSSSPDLIIFVWVSATTGGYQWMRQLRTAPATMHIPLLLLCSDAPALEAEYVLTGSTLLEKPLDLELLRRQVQQLIVPRARAVGSSLT